ncbi:hypothetical protein K8R20_01890 [bacterium]|nr:hypothetical protein [bacterium]
MRKNTLWKIIEKELVYWILIVILSAFFMYLVNNRVSRQLLLITGLLNVVILETWFVRIFFLFSGRKISQYSDVIQRISLRKRFFEYFILPAIFLSTFMLFLFFNKGVLMGYWVFILCMLVTFIMFVNVKSSLKHIYRINRVVKGVFDFICIITFYLSLNILFRVGLDMGLAMLLTSVIAFLMFLAELQLHNRINMISILISLASSLFVAFSIGCFLFQNIFVITSVGVVAFYLVVSLWNVRFLGKYKLKDYLTPFLYSIISLILIFSL